MTKVRNMAAGLILAVLTLQAAAGQGTPAAEAGHSRRVQYGEDDVIEVKARVRFTTLLVLPREETILDYTCGDREFWVINGTKNLAYCKPAKAGSETNLNLVTASGNVYSFILKEVSGDPEAKTDLKVFVEPKEGSVLAALKSEPRYVASEEAGFYRDQAASARQEAKAAAADAEKTVQAKVDTYLARYPGMLRFDYRYKQNCKPFLVTSIWNDGRFTYIRAAARELPALYELKDDRANLVSFDYRDGIYVVGKVVDRGYLAIGKARLPFFRMETK